MIREIVPQRMLKVGPGRISGRSRGEAKEGTGQAQRRVREGPRKAQERDDPGRRRREGRSQAGRESGREETQETCRVGPVIVQEGPRECLGKDPRASREGRPGKSRERNWITAIEDWGISRNSCMDDSSICLLMCFVQVAVVEGRPTYI